MANWRVSELARIADTRNAAFLPDWPNPAAS